MPIIIESILLSCFRETAERLNFGVLAKKMGLRNFTKCRVCRGLLFLRNRKADAFKNVHHKHRCAYACDRGVEV
ncbi:MAG: hypothetical protein MUE81_21415 [Thermoflexibacter sp.]|nr:hypothetical protein [Thermoflexibacter sp.]